MSKLTLTLVNGLPTLVHDGQAYTFSRETKLRLPNWSQEQFVKLRDENGRTMADLYGTGPVRATYLCQNKRTHITPNATQRFSWEDQPKPPSIIGCYASTLKELVLGVTEPYQPPKPNFSHEPPHVRKVLERAGMVA